jgi:phospholipase C
MRYPSVAAAVFAVAWSGCAAPGHELPLAPRSSSQMSTIQFDPQHRPMHWPVRHVIIIFQENRTPDNLFQGLKGADIASSGLNALGQTVPLHPVSLTAKYDLSHKHSGFLIEYQAGNMDGWSLEKSSRGCKRLEKATCAYGYVPASENRPYMMMARQYAFSDRMFQSNQGPSYPSHQFIVSGDAAALPQSPLEVSSNPLDGPGFHGSGGGCDAPPHERVDLINQSGFQRESVYPCFDRPVLSDLVDAKGLTWRYYQEGKGQGLWKAFDSIRHVRYGPDYANVVSPPDTVLSDIRHGNLADVVWVMPRGHDSDHSGSGFGGGPSWVAAVVNAIGKGKYWDTSAVLVSWDDWGGWYDHVKPPLLNSYELGFRVPLLVISPYPKRGYVSHVRHDFGSLLRFTEETFGLGSLETTDATSDNLRDCFDFAQPPRRFHRIPAPPYSPNTSDVDPDDDF